MSGGLTNPAQCIAYTVSASVDYAGLIVTRDGSTGKMKLASASTEIPEGYTFTTSKNPVTGESQSGVKVGICALSSRPYCNSHVACQPCQCVYWR